MFRLYSEHVPLDEIDDALLQQLGIRGVELALAVFPGTERAMRSVARRARDAKVSLVFWPLLDDREGRWPNGGNVRQFADHVTRVIDGMPPATLLFDLEPPIAWMREAVHWRYTPRPRESGSHAGLATMLRGRGWIVEAVVPPMLLYGSHWERWLGTRVSDLACQRVEPMVYSSLFEGYSRGLVPRRVARDLVVRITRRAGGAVALGVVGGGALGDEPAYRDVDELRDDVGLARAAGATRISLYSLDGILNRGELETWLDAFVRTPPRALPSPTRRGGMLERFATLIGSSTR